MVLTPGQVGITAYVGNMQTDVLHFGKYKKRLKNVTNSVLTSIHAPQSGTW
mgnify:CR=1 FL=1